MTLREHLEALASEWESTPAFVQEHVGAMLAILDTAPREHMTVTQHRLVAAPMPEPQKECPMPTEQKILKARIELEQTGASGSMRWAARWSLPYADEPLLAIEKTEFGWTRNGALKKAGRSLRKQFVVECLHARRERFEVTLKGASCE